MRVDATLTQSGKAADAKAVGDAVQGLQAAHDNLAAQVGAIQPGLTQAEKSALLTLLGGAAYGSAEMKASYDALSALWDGGDAPEVVPVQSVTISQGTLTLTVGDTATLTATVLPDNATDKTVTWTVSPSGFARVVGGVVTAQAAGECVVTASCGGKVGELCGYCARGRERPYNRHGQQRGRKPRMAGEHAAGQIAVRTADHEKESFKLKQLDFTIKLTGATSIEVSFYNKTKARNEGTNVIPCGHGGRLPRRGGLRHRRVGGRRVSDMDKFDRHGDVLSQRAGHVAGRKRILLDRGQRIPLEQQQDQVPRLHND